MMEKKYEHRRFEKEQEEVVVSLRRVASARRAVAEPQALGRSLKETI